MPHLTPKALECMIKLAEAHGFRASASQDAACLILEIPHNDGTLHDVQIFTLDQLRELLNY